MVRPVVANVGRESVAEVQQFFCDLSRLDVVRNRRIWGGTIRRSSKQIGPHLAVRPNVLFAWIIDYLPGASAVRPVRMSMA